MLFCTFSCNSSDESFIETEQMPYLSIGGNMDLNNLSQEDAKIVVEAIGRLSVHWEDNKPIIDTESEKEINVSRNLFIALQTIFAEETVSVTTRSSHELVGFDDDSDCLLHTIHHIMNRKARMSYEWLEKIFNYRTHGDYKSGVTLDAVPHILEAMFEFYRIDEQLFSQTHYNYYQEDLSRERETFGMIGIKKGKDYYHSVTVLAIEKGKVAYRDDQIADKNQNNKGEIVMAPITDFYCFYRLTKMIWEGGL